MIANARMYSVSPPATAAWRSLLGWVVQRAGLGEQFNVIDYPPPAPLPELWDRSDVGCVFMCGLPFAQREPQAIALAAPVPSNPAGENLPRYRSDLIVSADSPFQRIEDSFGSRLAYTEWHSQSGHHAVAHFLKAYQRPERLHLYAQTIGPLTTPRRVLSAILEGQADVGPLDSYAHDLLRLHEPELLSQVRTLASTEFTPMPLLVAAPHTEASVVSALRAALLAVEAEPSLADVRQALALTRFALVQARAYEVLAQRAAA